jgi:hypothetical protein
MVEYEYKCIPVPQTIQVSGKTGHDDSVKIYENLINTNASNGWEYHGLDVLESEKKVGCFSALLGKKDELFEFKLMIFKRQKK